MAGYRRVGDRRGRLRFEIVGQAWGALKMAGSPPVPHNRTGEAPTDAPGPLSPGPAERARPRLDDLIGPEVLEPSPAAPEQTGRGVDTARTRETVQLLDISMSGALLASPEHIAVGQRAASMTLSRDTWSFSSLADTLRLSATVTDAWGTEIQDAVVVWASVDSLVESEISTA